MNIDPDSGTSREQTRAATKRQWHAICTGCWIARVSRDFLAAVHPITILPSSNLACCYGKWMRIARLYRDDLQHLQMKKGWFSVAMLTYQRVHDVDADDVKMVFHLGMAIVKQIPTKTTVKKTGKYTDKMQNMCSFRGKIQLLRTNKTITSIQSIQQIKINEWIST